MWYNPIEQHVYQTVCQALLATEALTGPSEVVVKTTYPIAGWMHDVAARPKSSVAQCSTLAKWSAYLLQHIRSLLAINYSRFWGQYSAKLQPPPGLF